MRRRPGEESDSLAVDASRWLSSHGGVGGCGFGFGLCVTTHQQQLARQKPSSAKRATCPATNATKAATSGGSPLEYGLQSEPRLK